MSAQEFYALNPAKMERYQQFFIERMKQEHEHTSEVGWINGLYVSRAIDGAFPKGRRYPDSPLKVYKSQADDIEDDEDNRPITDAERFAAFAMVFNKKKFGIDTIDPVEDTAERQE